MAHIQTALRLRIHQNGKVSQRYLMAHERFSVGRSSDNDLVLFGESYPKNHVLVFNNNNNTVLRLPDFVTGEIRMKDSVLSIYELTSHRLLPRQGGINILPIFEGKEGYINLGEGVQIEFAFTKVTVQQTHLQPFDGFKWTRVFLNDLKKDLYFKLIFMFFLLLNSIILYAYKDIKIEHKEEDIAKQTERLVKISMKIIPQKEIEETLNPMAHTDLSDDQKSDQSEDKPKRERRPAKQQRSSQKASQSGGARNNPGGLLGIIAGTGNSKQGSSVLDFLVDKGLTADLNRQMGSGTNLKRGSGSGTSSSEDLLSGLIGTGGDGGLGGIDDLIEDIVDDEVEGVQLKKKTQVKVQQAVESTISQDAQGYRTQESVARVVGRIQGQLQYIYQKHLKKNVNFRGKVVVEFTISADGKIINARIRESTTNNSAFDNEILRAVKRLKFPNIPKGNATFVYPFVFQQMG